MAMPRAQAYFSESQTLNSGYLATPSMTTKSAPQLVHDDSASDVAHDEIAGF
jgi:hypothetical protein